MPSQVHFFLSLSPSLRFGSFFSNFRKILIRSFLMVGGDGTYFLIVFWYFQFDKLQNLKHTFPCKVPTDHPHFPISFFFPLSRIYPVITHYKASECPAPVSFIFECHCFEHTIFQKAIGFPVLIKVIILVSEIKEKSLKSSVQ